MIKHAMVIMRAQPPHVAHIHLIRQALEVAERVIVVLGSAFKARSPANPFTWRERADMIQMCLREEEGERILFVPIRDYHDSARWLNAVSTSVEAIAPRETVSLVGHFKDASSSYLRDFTGPQWQLHEVPSLGNIHATDIRKAIFATENPKVALRAVADIVPEAISDFLVSHLQRRLWDDIRAWAACINRERMSWGETPYLHYVLAADAVVQWRDRVLLIERNNNPGKGLLACPGGHVDPHELTIDAAIRELREETGLGFLAPDLKQMLVSQYFLESPGRSERPGRVVSMAYHFRIPDHCQQPELQIDPEEIASASWIKVDQLNSMEDRFFEDHYMSLDHFLRLNPN